MKWQLKVIDHVMRSIIHSNPFLAVTISKWDFDQESAMKGTESLYEDLTGTSSDNHHQNNE